MATAMKKEHHISKYFVHKREAVSDDNLITKKRKVELNFGDAPASSNDGIFPKKVGVNTDNLFDQIKNKLDGSDSIKWKYIKGENLNLQYTLLFSKEFATAVFNRLEREIVYFTGELAKLKVFGKWHDIPRQQVSFGDEGLSYKFSGRTVPAQSWTPFLIQIRQIVELATGHKFNFLLINRYRNGNDHIGEHRDDEKEIEAGAPIASLSFGQPRDFVFRHKDARGKNASRSIEPLNMILEHGSLLLMNSPTNKFWYHSLPPRKKLMNARINLTFRKMVIKNKNALVT